VERVTQCNDDAHINTLEISKVPTKTLPVKSTLKHILVSVSMPTRKALASRSDHCSRERGSRFIAK
jgi:hypothetical protein